LKKAIILCLLWVFFVPMMLRAQAESLWELTQVAIIDELGIQLNIPTGWVTNGFMFAENSGDLNALTDSEASTRPSGYVILIYGLPLTANENGMPSVEQAVNEFLLSSNGDISEYPYGVVNLRPSISLSFINPETQTTNLFTFWVQDNTLLTLQLITPSQSVDSSLTDIWGQITTSMRPILPESFEFADDMYEVTALGFSIRYPRGWHTTDSREVNGFAGIVFSQNEGEAGRELPTGIVISFWQDLNGRFTGFGGGTATPTEFAEAASRFFEETVHWEGQFNIHGQYGVGISSTWACCDLSNQPTVYHYFSIFLHDQSLDSDLWFQFTAPNEELYNQYLPVFFAMLQSIQQLEG
jgi:hypothetical protein